MTREVTHALAAAGGVADVDGVLQIEVRGQGREIIGIVIHVVTVGRLGRTPVTPAIMRDDAIAVTQEKHELGIPVVGAERPAVREDDRLSASPVLVEDLHSVLGRDRAHRSLSACQ